jgi:hypothetical protein
MVVHECDHSGFHSGVGKLSRDFAAIRFVLICDDCGQETREVHVEQYAPEYDPSGNSRAQTPRRAA